MTNFVNQGANAVTPAATTQAGLGLLNNPGVFQHYVEVATASTIDDVAASAVTLPKPATGLSTLLATGESLLAQFAELKATVFDRSDRALWSYLGNVYDWVLTINKSVQKRESKKALRVTIKERDGVEVSTAFATEAIVVRYLFPDVARQTRNNYVIALEKAIAEDLEQGQFCAFLEKNGGIAHVVEKDFNNGESETSSKVDAKAESTENVTLMRRLLNAKPHCGVSSELTSSEVEDYNLTFEQVEKLTEKQKSKSQNQRGEFVFFVAVPGAGNNEFSVVHGFKVARDVEERVLLEIAKGKEKSLGNLKAEVQNFETAAFEVNAEQ